MKKLIVGLLLLGGITSAEARRHQSDSWDTGTGSNSQYEKVGGYQKQDGTYVDPYYRTKADNTLDNNYGTRGNQNPWTGKTGTGNTDYDQQQQQSNPWKWNK